MTGSPSFESISWNLFVFTRRLPCSKLITCWLIMQKVKNHRPNGSSLNVFCVSCSISPHFVLLISTFPLGTIHYRLRFWLSSHIRTRIRIVRSEGVVQWTSVTGWPIVGLWFVESPEDCLDPLMVLSFRSALLRQSRNSFLSLGTKIYQFSSYVCSLLTLDLAILGILDLQVFAIGVLSF